VTGAVRSAGWGAEAPLTALVGRAMAPSGWPENVACRLTSYPVINSISQDGREMCSTQRGLATIQGVVLGARARPEREPLG
jgi:hypothetical protein